MSFLSAKKQLRWIMGLNQKAKWKMTFWGISFSNISVVVVKSSLFHVLEKCADIPTMHLIFTPCREIQKIRSAHKKRTFQKKYYEGNRYLCINGDMPFSFVCIQYIILWFMERGRLFYTTCWLHILKHLLSHILSAPILSHYIFKHVAISVFSKLFFNMSLSLYYIYHNILSNIFTAFHSNW